MLPVKSKEMVEEFCASNKTESVLELEKDERSNTIVYSALHAFLKRNPDYKVKVRMHKGNIVLIKYDEQRTATDVHNN